MVSKNKWQVNLHGGIMYDHEVTNEAEFIETSNEDLAEAICEFLNKRDQERALPGINEEETE